MMMKRPLLTVLILMFACKGEMTTSTSSSTSATTETVTPKTAAATTTAAGPCGTTTTSGGESKIPAVVVSGNMPLSVPLPAQINSPEQIRPDFDWYSWEEFVALNWPASTTGRGNPDQPGNASAFLKAPNGTPTVWGTYKANWELFNQGSARPTPFDSYDVHVPAQCSAGKPGEKRLVMSSKGNTVLNDGVQAFSFPLVDAARNYIFYEVRYGRDAYDFMRGTDADPKSWLYLAKNLSPPKQQTMPSTTANPAHVGAIMLKAAWRDMSSVPAADQSRYYVVPAEVYDPSTKQCSMKSVGLVGFHVVQKLQGFGEWIWSSFEQVDNLSTPERPGMLPACTDTNCSQAHGFSNRPQSLTLEPDPAKRVPVNAARLNPIPTTPAGASTVDVNATFQKALAGTPWAFYQLVITQWPTSDKGFKPPEDRGTYPCASGIPFPQDGAVNVALETYFQSAEDANGAGGNSCMRCHYNAAITDFSWGLNRRPH